MACPSGDHAASVTSRLPTRRAPPLGSATAQRGLSNSDPDATLTRSSERLGETSRTELTAFPKGAGRNAVFPPVLETWAMDPTFVPSLKYTLAPSVVRIGCIGAANLRSPTF